MKGFILILTIVFAALFISCTDSNKEYSIDIDNFYGVWANSDCELVKTGLYEILFERSGDKITASIKRFTRDKNKLIIDTRAVAVFDTLTKSVIVKAKSLGTGDSLLLNDDTSNLLTLSAVESKISKYAEKLVIQNRGEVIEELSTIEPKLRILTQSGNWQNLDLVEKIQPTSSYEVIKAADKYLGVCLQQWQLGTSFMVDQEGNVNTIEINTNRHSYVYNFNGSADEYLLYCRAARIRSNNNGTVFSQNIRLMKSPNEFTAWMTADNLTLSSKEVVIEDSLFSPNVCVFAANGIYWSMKSFNDTTIVINGCGEDYTYVRPKPDSQRIIEWFEFAEY